MLCASSSLHQAWDRAVREFSTGDRVAARVAHVQIMTGKGRPSSSIAESLAVRPPTLHCVSYLSSLYETNDSCEVYHPPNHRLVIGIDHSALSRSSRSDWGRSNSLTCGPSLSPCLRASLGHGTVLRAVIPSAIFLAPVLLASPANSERVRPLRFPMRLGTQRQP